MFHLSIDQIYLVISCFLAFMNRDPIWYIRLETYDSRENPFVLWVLCQADKTGRFTVNWFLHSSSTIMFLFFFRRGNVLSLTVFEEQCLKPLENVSTKHPQKGITDQIFIMLTDALCSLMCTPYCSVFLSQRAHKHYCNLNLTGNTRGMYVCTSFYDCLTSSLGYPLFSPVKAHTVTWGGSYQW